MTELSLCQMWFDCIRIMNFVSGDKMSITMFHRPSRGSLLIWLKPSQWTACKQYLRFTERTMGPWRKSIKERSPTVRVRKATKTRVRIMILWNCLTWGLFHRYRSMGDIEFWKSSEFRYCIHPGAIVLKDAKPEACYSNIPCFLH